MILLAFSLVPAPFGLIFGGHSGFTIASSHAKPGALAASFRAPGLSPVPPSNVNFTTPAINGSNNCHNFKRPREYTALTVRHLQMSRGGKGRAFPKVWGAFSLNVSSADYP